MAATVPPSMRPKVHHAPPPVRFGPGSAGAQAKPSPLQPHRPQPPGPPPQAHAGRVPNSGGAAAQPSTATPQRLTPPPPKNPAFARPAVIQRGRTRHQALIEEAWDEWDGYQKGNADALRELANTFNHKTKYYHGRAVKRDKVGERPVIGELRMRPGLDFDPSDKAGFYLGSSLEGAVEWASNLAAKSRRHAVEEGRITEQTRPCPVVFEYAVEDGLVAQLNGQTFPENPDFGHPSWQRFIYNSRTRQGSHRHTRDWVSGAMIQNVSELQKRVEEGADPEEIIALIERVPDLDQIALYTQEAWTLFNSRFVRIIQVPFNDAAYVDLERRTVELAQSRREDGQRQWEGMSESERAEHRKRLKEEKKQKKQQRVNKSAPAASSSTSENADK